MVSCVVAYSTWVHTFLPSQVPKTSKFVNENRKKEQIICYNEKNVMK